MSNKTLLIITIIISILTACSPSGKSPALPRPTAYYRPALPDTVLTIVENVPLTFLANSEANIEQPRHDWLNIIYPSLGATVYITFSQAESDKIDDVKENRMERIILNAGDSPIDFAEWSNPSGFNIVTAATEGTMTPLQFIASDDSEWVVSGTLCFADSRAAERIDSMRPIINAIAFDIDRALKSLDYHQ